MIVPSEVVTNLIYSATGNVTNNGSSTAGQRWHTNAPYDVDPILGSTSMAGYSEWAAFYHFVRSTKYKVVIEVTNNEPNPVTVFFTHSNNDLGTTGTLSQSQSGNSLTRTVLLAPSGYGGTKKLTMAHTINAVVGSPAPLTDDNYRSLTNAVPADLTWFGIYLNTGNINTLTAFKGIQYSMRIIHTCHFYGRNVLNV